MGYCVWRVGSRFYCVWVAGFTVHLPHLLPPAPTCPPPTPQVYSMHKSLTDWLQDPACAAEFYVDSRMGHEILGKYLFRQAVGRQVRG